MRGHPKTKWNAKQLPVVLPRPPLSCTVGEVEATPKALDQHDFLLSCKFLAGNELWHANVKQYVQREPWQKKTTFFLHCILLKFYCSAFCQGIYKSALFDVLSTWEVRSRLDGSTGPAWDDDTVVKAQCQRNWRIIHQHHAFHGAAQTTQILQQWKRDASDARPGNETPLHFWHRFSVVSVVFEHSALRKAPPRSTQCWPQVCEKTWQRIWQKAKRQQHQHIATPKLTKMVQHETRKNSCTDLHSLCHWRYCMGKHGSLAFNFRHVFLDGKSIELQDLE